MIKENRLIKEKSPYLLQHAHNPVDWFPWSEEAFNKAKEEDKPIFLSIGYSTCHWCHVMEKESFEDQDIAGLMNETFINIKVDREERPDIDSNYMFVCQILTGSGGWPLTIIMTPDKKPFFAGTYFPKESRFNRPGLIEMIPRIKEFWINKRDDVLKSAHEITETVKQNSIISNKNENVDPGIFNIAYDSYLKMYDSRYGGFGSSPKFPSPHNLTYLLRYWKRSKDNFALEMVTKTLTEMRKGGIYDHLGYGFHRYSTDAKWLVPHFEKMLYDQALMIMAYTEAFQASGNNLFKRTVQEIVSYVLRDMTSPEGGFYSAEDADSEGVEGKFYLWTMEELLRLNDKNVVLLLDYFNVLEKGNWIDPVHGTGDGTNILHTNLSLDQLSEELKIPKEDLEQKIETVREKLFTIREKRIHPHKDDKILTDWNSLMISALSRSAFVLDSKEYLQAAEKGIKFILENLMDGNMLKHRYREGSASIEGNADDYSFFIQALLDYYEASFNLEYLIKAIQINDLFIDLFWDNESGGFFFTSARAEEILFKQKDLYDGAVPSANSVAVLNLQRIGRYTGNPLYDRKANEIIKYFASQINSAPSSFSQTLAALDFAYGPAFQIIIAGNKENSDTSSIIASLRLTYLPNKVIIYNFDNISYELTKILPSVKAYHSIDDKTTTYVCKDYQCELPVFNSKDMVELLKL